MTGFGETRDGFPLVKWEHDRYSPGHDCRFRIGPGALQLAEVLLLLVVVVLAPVIFTWFTTSPGK